MSDLNDGLVVHLLMDEIDENGRVSDASGRGNHGRSIGTPPDWFEDPEVGGGFLVFYSFSNQLTIGETKKLGIFDTSFTVAAWVCFTVDVEEPARILFTTISIPPQESGDLSFPFSFGIGEGAVQMTLHPDFPLQSKQRVKSRRWYHFAFRYDRSSQEQSIFIDGIDDSKGGCPPVIEEWLSDLPQQMVGVGDSDPAFFMCDLRCYDRALSDEDIQVIANPEYRKQITIPVNREPVQAEPFPIEFHLRDNDDQPVLSSRSIKGQQLTLEVKNTTPGAIQLAPIPPHSTGLDRYHFILRFRKGILSSVEDIALAAISADDGWQLDRHHPDLRHDRFDELCFLRETEMTLSPGNRDSCLLTLENVRADEERGTRNSRVELLYRNLVYKEQPLIGYREETFSVVNKFPPEASEEEKQARDAELAKIHERIIAVESNVSDSVKKQLEKYDKQVVDLHERVPSKKDLDYLNGIQAHLQQLVKDNPDQEALAHLDKISTSITKLQEFERNPRGPLPLHVGFDGSNTVLNDATLGQTASGTKTTLTLKLTALGSHDGIAFGPESRLILGFDIATDDQAQAWSLCHSSEIRIGPTLDMGWENPQYPIPGDPRYTWTFTRKNQPGYALLEKDEALTLTIENIHSSMPSGPTNLYLSYENIFTKEKDDGTRGMYKDSQFILQVIKTPLYFSNKNVGIGTTEVQDNRLTVEGNVKVNGDVKLTGKNYLEFGTGVAGKETNAGKIGYQTWSGDALDIVGAGEGGDRRITFHAEGNSKFSGPVGVEGKVTLQKDLDVWGGVRVGAGFDPSKSVQPHDVSVEGNILVKGKIGVGTDSPADLLHLKGSTDAGLIIEAGAEPFIEFQRSGDVANRWMIGIDDGDNAFRIARATGEMDPTTAATTKSFVDIQAPVRNSNVRESHTFPAYTTTTGGEIFAFHFTTHCESDVLLLADFQRVMVSGYHGCTLSFGLTNIKSHNGLEHSCYMHDSGTTREGYNSSSGHMLLHLKAGTYRAVAFMSTDGASTASISGGTLTVIQL